MRGRGHGQRDAPAAGSVGDVLWLVGRAAVGIRQRDLGAFCKAGNCGAALGEVLDLDLALLEPVAGLDEDVRSCRSSRARPDAARAGRSESPCPESSRAQTRRP